MKPLAGLVAITFALLARSAHADLTIYTDHFLEDYPAGSIALVVDRVSEGSSPKRVRVMDARDPTTAARRKQCLVAIAHRDTGQVGLQTFAGVQIVKLFTRHPTSGLLHVGRNDGWMSAPAGKKLTEIRAVELVKTSITDFAAMHGNPVSLTDRPLLLGARKNVEWHASAISQDAESYSASDDHARFWAKNPLEEPELKAMRDAMAKDAKDVRVENRLMRFQLTDSRSSSKMPKVQFDCSDPSLSLVAIRIYRPFSTDPQGWGFLEFK